MPMSSEVPRQYRINGHGMRRLAIFQVGDRVLYGIHGVCCAVDRETRHTNGKDIVYLVLEPVGQEGARFLIPVHNAAAMAKLHPMLTKKDVDDLLDSDDVRSDCWIPDENRRKQAYRELIGSGDRVQLLRMVRTLHIHKASQAAAGRKCHICDENFLRDAEKLLTVEFSMVLNMEPNRVRTYLRERLEP